MLGRNSNRGAWKLQAFLVNIMKKQKNQILFVTAAAVALTSASPLLAQSQVTAPGGIAASPRVRQMLEERASWTRASARETAASQPAGRQTTTIAASPRVQHMLREQKRSALASTTDPVLVSPRDADGIAASPKARELLKERPTQFQIAPLK